MEIGMGELLELIVDLDGINHIHRPQLWKCLESAVKDVFKRRSRHLSMRVNQLWRTFWWSCWISLKHSRISSGETVFEKA
jgi:hypothetical protein